MQSRGRTKAGREEEGSSLFNLPVKKKKNPATCARTLSEFVWNILPLYFPFSPGYGGGGEGKEGKQIAKCQIETVLSNSAWFY